MQKSSIKYILKLSIPIFFANLAVPLVGIIDTSLMGNLEELSYLSATSIAANLFSMIFGSKQWAAKAAAAEVVRVLLFAAAEEIR